VNVGRTALDRLFEKRAVIHQTFDFSCRNGENRRRLVSGKRLVQITARLPGMPVRQGTGRTAGERRHLTHGVRIYKMGRG